MEYYNIVIILSTHIIYMVLTDVYMVHSTYTRIHGVYTVLFYVSLKCDVISILSK